MLEPPYQTYSSVGQARFHRRLSAHEPPHEVIVIMGLAQARPNKMGTQTTMDKSGLGMTLGIYGTTNANLVLLARLMQARITRP